MTYFADVPVNAQALASGLYDLDSVQVLRGPQGTLFGKNSTGGAVVFTPRQPDLHDLNGYADVVYGSFNLLQYTGAVNLPLVDGLLAVRLSGQSAQQDGTVKNIHGVDGRPTRTILWDASSWISHRRASSTIVLPPIISTDGSRSIRRSPPTW